MELDSVTGLRCRTINILRTLLNGECWGRTRRGLFGVKGLNTRVTKSSDRSVGRRIDQNELTVVCIGLRCLRGIDDISHQSSIGRHSDVEHLRVTR